MVWTCAHTLCNNDGPSLGWIMGGGEHIYICMYKMTFTSSSNCLTLILSPKPLFLAQVMLTSNSWVWCMRIASPLQWSSGTIGSQPQSLSSRVRSHQCSDAIIRDCWLANACYISPRPLVVAFANSWMPILRSIIPAVLKAPTIPDV